MSFENGNFALTICPLSTRLPDGFLEKLASATAGKLDDVGTEDPQLGWVSGRHILESEISERTALFGGHLNINLRKAERKVPSSLLRAICRRDEYAYMQTNDTTTVPRQEKKRIKEQAMERTAPKMPPSISATQVAVDMASNVMYVGTGSLKQVDLIIAAFVKELGVEPVPINSNELMIKLLGQEANALPNVDFNGHSKTAEMDMTPGRDFLTWLWFHSEENGGIFRHEQYGEFQLAVEGPLTFGFSATEAKGAEETVVKKGCPQLSAEAKAALGVGKKLRKAKLVIARDQDIWNATFDADRFTFTGVTLPEGEEMDPSSYFAERMEYIHILHTAVEGYFKLFAEAITGPDRPEVERALHKWANDRESF